MSSIKIEEDLTLNYIEENMVKEDKLITLECWFTFFGKTYTAYLSVNSLDGPELKFPSIEGPGILFESFEEQIERSDVQEIIKTEAKKIVKQYNENLNE